MKPNAAARVEDKKHFSICMSHACKTKGQCAREGYPELDGQKPYLQGIIESSMDS